MTSTPDHKPAFCWCHDDEIPAEVLDETRDSQPDAAPQEPQAGVVEGETYVSSWGELLYLMTRGEMGTKPQTPLQPRTFHTPR